MTLRLNGKRVLSSPVIDGTVTTLSGTLTVDADVDVGANYLQFSEIADPAAAAANGARVYAKDSGAAKTQFAQLYASGAAQVATTEP